MADGERWEIFDDDDDTTLILHTGKSSQLSIEVSAECIEFVFINSENCRSCVIAVCEVSNDVRSILRATMKAQEASDGEQ